MPRSCRQHGHGEWCTCEHQRWGLPPVARAADAGEVVLGLHLIERGQPVVVVEGPIDAAVCGPGFVSCLGAHVTPEQAALIAASGPSEAIVLFDGDEGGYNAAPKAVATLGAYLETRMALCPNGRDPGELGAELSYRIAMSAHGDQGLRPLGQPIMRRAKTREERTVLSSLVKN